MAKAKSLSGKDLMLWIGGKVVALSTSCKLNMSVSTIDSATKDDGMWQSPEVGGMSWDVSNESVWAADEAATSQQVHSSLFELYVAGEPVDVTVGVPSNQSNEGLPEDGWKAAATGVYAGKALITSLSYDGSKGSNAAISVSLQGVGKLELKSE